MQRGWGGRNHSRLIKVRETIRFDGHKKVGVINITDASEAAGFALMILVEAEDILSSRGVIGALVFPFR